ncbi:MAG TPA: hypothetical protein VFE47_02885 [Tepidisphaeraceae bacterium]|jgi:hypothetical protein|nr:hypothetical protein [Tepidisphaeraceae bacterium]
MRVEHWMMFGTFAEQRHFIYPSKDTYDGVIINGNMAAHAPDGLAAFLLEKTESLNYIIDPLTHAFQHDPRFISDPDGEPKSSIRAIADAYGEPVCSTIGKRPIHPRDFEKDEILLGYVKRCLAFQKCVLADAMAESDAIKYLDLDADGLQPRGLVAPYFYITETTIDSWLPLAIRAVEYAIELEPEARIFASIVVSQGVILDNSARERIIEAFGPINVAGFLLWIDALDEQAAESAELGGLLTLARGLRQEGKREVINLHGGYFSILAAGVLGKGIMSGVTHGPEFGEHRAVVPVGGGIPIARYYIPKLHARIRYRETVRLLDAKHWLDDTDSFYKNVCQCPECKSTIGTNIDNFLEFGKGNVKAVKRGGSLVRIEYPTGETKLHCLRHYLNRKKTEYELASTATGDVILKNLADGVSEFEDVLGLDGVSHLKLWAKVLGK